MTQGGVHPFHPCNLSVLESSVWPLATPSPQSPKQSLAGLYFEVGSCSEGNDLKMKLVGPAHSIPELSSFQCEHANESSEA